MELTSNDIAIAFDKIKKLDDNQMLKIIDDGFDTPRSQSWGSSSSISIGFIQRKTSKQELQEICINAVQKYKDEIQSIADNKPASFILDVLEIVAPSVAEKVYGVTAMVVVAALIVAIKRFLKS